MGGGRACEKLDALFRQNDFSFQRVHDGMGDQGWHLDVACLRGIGLVEHKTIEQAAVVLRDGRGAGGHIQLPKKNRPLQLMSVLISTEQ